MAALRSVSRSIGRASELQQGRAVVPGTFDPVTFGHLDIIERAASLFDDIVVAVSSSPDKGRGPLFSVEERCRLVRESTKHLSNVEVHSFDTLLVDFVVSLGSRVVIKGLRAVSDFEREFQMAQLNHGLEHDIETMFIMAIPKYAYLSSSAVREIASHGGDVTSLIPSFVAKALTERLAQAR